MPDLPFPPNTPPATPPSGFSPQPSVSPPGPSGSPLDDELPDAPVIPGAPVSPQSTPAPLPEPEPELEEDDSEEVAQSLSPARVLGKNPPANGAPDVSLPVPPTPPLAPPPVAPVPPVPTPPPVVPQPAQPPVSPSSLPPAPVPPAPPTAPAAPPMGGPFNDDIDKDLLLKHAAEEPAQPLILPQRKFTQPGDPNAEEERERAQRVNFMAPPPPLPKPQPPRPTGEAGPSIQGLEGKPLTSLTSATQAPPPPLPPLRPALKPVPPLPTPKPAPTPPKFSPPAPHRSHPLLVVLGSGVVLVMLIGGLFVLALSGARIPFLGKMVSGLEGSVASASARAKAFVDTMPAYRLGATGTIQLQDGKAAVLGDGTQAVTTLKTEVKEAFINDKEQRFMVVQNITANNASAVPIVLRSVDSDWLISFPANIDQTITRVPATALVDTLLQPVIRPVPAGVILGGVQQEQAYRKQAYSQDGKAPIPVATYTASVNPDVLKDYFPKAASIQNPVAVISLAWKTGSTVAGQPMDIQLGGTFVYQEHTYQFSLRWSYDGWGSEKPVLSELGTLAGIDPTTITKSIGTEDVVARMGISFKALPHGVRVSDAGTSVFTPIVPSGEVITAVQSERLEGAAVPEQPASADAKSRDAQRKRDLADIQKAFEQYKSDTGAYPSVSAETQLGSSATLFNALVPKYLTKMPVDPLNSTYYYTYNITSTGYVLRSILEDHSDTMGVTGQTYHYYQVTNK